MILLLTILFVAALLVLVAGGLLASDPSRNPPETPANLLGRRQGEFRRPALGKCAEEAEADEEDCWWRDWWIYAE